MNIQQAIQEIIQGKDLSSSKMEGLMRQIMAGDITNAQLASFLTALHMKGESVAEIFAAAQVVRSLAKKINITGKYTLDTCGTGGDKSGIFNVSTASSFVAAAADITVAKHGNRSFLSSSGSADVLEAAGANIALSTAQVKTCIATLNIGFLFAPLYHSAIKHAGVTRKEIGIHTIFNLLGPLANPAKVTNQLLGVYDKKKAAIMLEVLQKLGSNHVMTVNSTDGLDEISLKAPTTIYELHHNLIHNYTITPEDFGIKNQSLQPLKVSSPKQSLALIRQAFKGQEGPALDMIALNAGAAIYVANRTSNLSDGIVLAQNILHTGLAENKLLDFIRLTQELGNKS